MSWFLAFVGFAALIVLHEFGHFAAAKAVGMRVERFSLFFGPMLVKVRRGETEYGIGVIPLGGYVKISGMNPHEELPPEVADRAYFRQKPWKRIVVILAGPAMNLLIAFAIFVGIFVFKGQPTQALPVVDSVAKGTAAAQVLRPGDRILAVDGVRGDPEKLRAEIGRHRCAGTPTNGCRAATPVRLTLLRDGHRVSVRAYPRFDTTQVPPRPLLGFSFALRYQRESVPQACRDAVSGMWTVTKLTVSAIGRIFVSEKARKQVSGVVGTYEATRQTFQTADYLRALQVLALISLSLAIVNLFPFLPLDGGHVFWAVAEKIRRRPIPFSVMERAGVIGFMLVIGLFVIGFLNDLNRLQGAGFGIR
jgi:regulator of sigma E protease